MKLCTKCGEKKPLRRFHRDKSRRDGRRGWCIDCVAAYQTALPRDPERVRRNSIKSKYGLTVEEYDALVAQGCSACGSTVRVVLDHDHVTGDVRGPLCTSCNVALGLLEDEPQRLLALMRYLTEHGCS